MRSVSWGTLSKDGVRPDKRLVDKILGIKRPNDRKELERFLDLVNYFGRYINHFAELTEPLNELRRKNVEFMWGEAQEKAFKALKNALHEYPVVRPFDPIIIIIDSTENCLQVYKESTSLRYCFLWMLCTLVNERQSSCRSAVTVLRSVTSWAMPRRSGSGGG